MVEFDAQRATVADRDGKVESLVLDAQLAWAGLATLPITACMLLFASRGGALGQRIGPRIPMTVGPLVMAAGTVMLLGVGERGRSLSLDVP